MKIIHLQNLPSNATSGNVRDFFEGFHVAEGGVHITTSYDGSVFVSFTSDKDAMAAVHLDGRRIFGEPVKLSLCSEEEKEDRLKKLDEEDQILTDCQEIEDHPSSHEEELDRFGPNYREQKLRSDIFAAPPTQAEVGHLRSALYDNYIQVRNLNPRTEVADVLRFFKGIRPAVRRDAIVVRDAGDGTERSVAFLRIENRRAFEIALKMDESLLDGYLVQIMECTREDFESAMRSEEDFREYHSERPWEIMHDDLRPRLGSPVRRRRSGSPVQRRRSGSPVRRRRSGSPMLRHRAGSPAQPLMSASPVRHDEYLRGIYFQEYDHDYPSADQAFEYHLYVKMLPSHVTKGDVSKLFQKSDPGYISVRPDRHNRGRSEALVVFSNKNDLQRAMGKDKIWYEGVQLEVRQYSKKPMRSNNQKNVNQRKVMDSIPDMSHPYLFLADLSESVSPRDVRDLFGVLSRSIPRDGIIIRPDQRGDVGYVAFVKFDSELDFFHAKDMWKDGLYLKGKKVYQSMCTSALIRTYNIDSLWGQKSVRYSFGTEAPRPRTSVYQQSSEPERPEYWRSRSRSRSRSPIRSRHSEHSFGEAWRRNSRGQSSEFGEAARAVAKRESKIEDWEFLKNRRNEPDFGEASRRNHDEAVRRGMPIQYPKSSSVEYFRYDQYENQSPPRYRHRSRSLSPVRSLPMEKSWSPSMDSSRSPSPSSLRTRSRSPALPQSQRSYSPDAPVTSDVPLQQNPGPNTWTPSSVPPPAPAPVETPQQPRFIRVSPMPSWANDIWLTQFFSDCNIKKTSVLIKYNAGTPVHAYLECMTSADVEKACQRNGTYVGTDRICVEPLGGMFK